MPLQFKFYNSLPLLRYHLMHRI